MEKITPQRSSLVKRVVLFGPESTGKTTLAKQLSDRFGVPWVPEFSREYLQEKWDRERLVCQREDLLPIAVGQMMLENQAVAMAEQDEKPFVICDTNLLQTIVYSGVYYEGWVDSILMETVAEQQYDLYLLTGIDVPWVADDLRDKPHEREAMYEAFREALIENQCRFIELEGSESSRLELASAAIYDYIYSSPI